MKKKSENNYDICITKICGYLIFQEKKENKNSICCEGCRVGFRKFNHSWCSCCNCQCLECEQCCPCLPLSECCKTKADLTEIGDRDKSLCICYKLNGKCSWLCEYFTNALVICLTLFVIIIELLNFGFNSFLTEYIDNYIYEREYNHYMFSEINKKTIRIHILYLIGIIFYYCLNLVFGLIFYKKFPIKKVEYIGEESTIGLGIIFLVLFESIISCIFSSLIYYNNSEEYKYYLMAFSVSSVEYIKLLEINFISKNSENKTQLFAYSTFISIFLLIINTILTAIEYLVKDHNIFIFVQFLLGIIISFFGICYLIIIICFMIKKGIKSHEDLERLDEEIKKERIEILKQKEEIRKKQGEEFEEFKKKQNEEVNEIVFKGMLGASKKENPELYNPLMNQNEEEEKKEDNK